MLLYIYFTGIGGLEDHILKSATISSTLACTPFCDLYFDAAIYISHRYRRPGGSHPEVGYNIQYPGLYAILWPVLWCCYIYIYPTGIGGLEDHILKSATISSTLACTPFCDLYFDAAIYISHRYRRPGGSHPEVSYNIQYPGLYPILWPVLWCCSHCQGCTRTQTHQ